MKIIKLSCALLMMLWMSASQASMLTLNIDSNGILLGASNVDVAGTKYDVAFNDDSCSNLFSGCSNVRDFTFQKSGDAILAMESLRDQVLLDSELGNFDSELDKVFGCVIITSCFIYTPYQPSHILDNVSVAYYERQLDAPTLEFTSGDPYRNVSDDGNLPSDRSTSLDDNVTFAVWTRVASVPEPGSFILLSLGIAGMFFTRHKKQF